MKFKIGDGGINLNELLSISGIMYSLLDKANHVKVESHLDPPPILASLSVPHTQFIYCKIIEISRKCIKGKHSSNNLWISILCWSSITSLQPSIVSGIWEERWSEFFSPHHVLCLFWILYLVLPSLNFIIHGTCKYHNYTISHNHLKWTTKRYLFPNTFIYWELTNYQSFIVIWS